MTRLLTIFALIAPLSMLAACGDDSSTVDQSIGSVDGGMAPACNPPCSGNTTCINGSCQVQTVTCTPACAAGQMCVNGLCTNGNPNMGMGCVTNANCPMGQLCNSVTRRCEQNSSTPACTTNEQCMNGYCDMGRCMPGCRAEKRLPNGLILYQPSLS